MRTHMQTHVGIVRAHCVHTVRTHVRFFALTKFKKNFVAKENSGKNSRVLRNSTEKNLPNTCSCVSSDKGRISGDRSGEDDGDVLSDGWGAL